MFARLFNSLFGTKVAGLQIEARGIAEDVAEFRAAINARVVEHEVNVEDRKLATVEAIKRLTDDLVDLQQLANDASALRF
jgi:tRNA threonylcarbamoyladenosine modification (KEOPS) complex  Pcc1 subunit